MPTLLESLGAPPQSLVPTSVMEPTEPLAPPAPTPDPFEAAGWEEVKAVPDPFEAAGWEEVKAEPDPFEAAGWKEADDLDTKSVEELAASRDTFNPKEYYANHPELFSDPKKAAKLLDVYRIRDKEGLDAGQVAKAAVKEALPTAANIAGGVRDVVEGAINVGLQPIANVFGGILTGDVFNKQRREELLAETKREQKRGVAQFGAGSEASATGIADLGRQAIRKMASSPDQSPFAVGLAGSGISEEQVTGKPAQEKTDQELLQQLAADTEFGKQLGEIVQGKGESAKAVGLDADTLAKEGIALDPEVIERLSLVDPLTIIAGGGIFKGVTAAGKTAFTATTRAAAEATIQRITQVATRAATSPIRAVGKGIELTGALSKKVAPLAPTVGAASGGVAGGLSGAGAGYLAGVGAQRTLRIGGKLLESGGRGVAAAGEALGNSRILQQTLRGAAEGVIATAPLAAATDDDLAAGTLLGAGGLLGGGIRGAIATAEAPALAIARSRLAPKNIVYPETKSTGYRRDKILDAAHEEAIQTIPQAEKNEINAFRETARKLDSELYFLDDINFAVATQENAARVLGRELTGQEKVDLGRTAGAEGFFDFTVPGSDGKPRRVIFLRKSADAATHEVGHLFFKTLAPERQATLVQSVRDSYTPEQIEQVRADQSQRLGENKSTDYAINEIAADNFSQVFRNTPVSELTAPPGLLQEIRRNVTDFAENLGLDLTAGERTASVGVESSLRFNDVVRDAARELLSPKPRQPVVTPKAAPITLDQAARDLGPLVEPRVVRQTPARPTPEAGAAPEAPKDVVDEARKIADEAPDTALPGAAMSQKEILGTVADIIAGKEGARYNYRNAPDVPGAAEEASRAPRRAEIEQARNLPEDLRRMTETTGIPYRIVKSSGGVVQVLDWAPDMLASNALRVAKALSDLAVKDPSNPVLQKVKYGLDVQKGEWTEQGWRDIFADAEIFSANQGKGFAGSGIALDFPPEVVAAGRTAPAVTGTPVPLEQGIADFQNMLYNLRVPKTPRQGAKLPGNLVSQKISEATLPGRLRQPALVEPRKAGETGVRKPFKSGEEILDPNPLRAEFETALQGASIPLPDGIEVVRRLNLEHIADVVAEPNLPKTVGGVTPVLEAGFAAPPLKPGEREWRVSGQRRGVTTQLTLAAVDMTGARKLAEAQGMRVAKIEAADKVTNAMFAAPKDNIFPETRARNEVTERGDTSFFTRTKPMSVNPVELARQVEQFSPDEFRGWVQSINNNNFTQAAYDLGRAAPDRAFVDSLKRSYEEIAPGVMKAMKALAFDDASAIASQAQFFREAHEAATGTASAGKRLRDTEPDYVPPFPPEEAVIAPITVDEIPAQFAAPKRGGKKAEKPTGETLKVFHFSNLDNLTQTDPAKMKSSVHAFWGQESPKTFFFVEGSAGEPGAQFKNRTAYEAKLDRSKLYDATEKDPLGYTTMANRVEADQAVIDAGHNGVIIPIVGGQKVVVMFDPVAVKPVGKTTVIGKFSEPSGRRATPRNRTIEGDGWIDPEGRFFHTTEHHEFAESKLTPAEKEGISEDFTGALVKKGWARISTGKAGKYVQARELSKAQKVTLEDWAADTRGRVLLDTSKEGEVLFDFTEPVEGPFAAPKSEGELGLEIPKDVRRAQRALRAQVAESREKYPEAVPLDIRKEEDGSYKIDAKGKPVFIETPYGLDATPLAKEAAKGKRGDEAKDSAIDRAYADKIKEAYEIAKENPEIAAGANWYSLARTKLKALFGEDTKFFTELLGATSAQTDVPTNFRYAIEAYNNFKLGKYDAQIQKYQEGKAIWETRDSGLEEGETPFAQVLEELGLPPDATSAAFREAWINKHNLKPQKNNGTLFGANSDPVLRVLDGSWREEVQGPKTPNFADNLLGTSFEATIDIWAARLLHRLGNEGNTKRWRILPKNEDAVSDPDFYRGQRAFRLAGDELGVSPDSLQAIMWFAEKDFWNKSGWTKKAGAEKSDFNAFLDVTTRGYSERLKGPGKLVIDEAALKKPEQKKEKAQLDFGL